MPPRRRAPAQSTLAFGAQSRITKPSKSATTIDKGKDIDSPLTQKTEESISNTPEPQHVVATEHSAPAVAELVMRQQTTTDRRPSQTPEEKQALRLTLKDLNKWWNQKEGKPKPVKVHESGLKLEEKILRNFDLTGHYGPCIGMSRLQRWHRAQRMGLNPPIEVLAVLLNGNETSERSHMEELVD
ncbi:uncharacterized protein N7483_011858 [Penicillium malachiteum]|uniref:uncharacterized protein n=1 Tax=Penicillium malachiteum TaxID=1324776 RepID=UPI002547E0DA|nr:uncharacterized protein N7483_011858 [Penicillium malachiteum]KAJ5714677.1 hypothetical protein N7483_011858 [Penicillium malachiteum]